MNIGFFTDSYLPQISGVVNSIELFRNELERRGHQVFVFAPKIPKAAKKEDRIFRFRSFGLGPLFAGKGNLIPNRFTFPLSIHHFFKINDLKLDIVHSHTEMGMGALANFVAKTKKIPHVHTYHTHYPEYVHYLAKGKLLSPKGAEKLSAMYCNGCDLVITPSEKIKDSLWKYGVKSRIEVLATGIDLASFSLAKKDAFRKKYQIDKNTKIMLYVGRMGKEKSVDILIWGFAAAGVENSLLVLVGDGPERKKYEEMTKRLAVEKNVLFTGMVPWQDAIEAYAAADLFLFASATETQGLVLLEAAASGLPIIAIDDNVVNKFVQARQNGILVKSAEEMAQAIKKFFENPWEAAKMEKASRQIAGDYSIQHQTEKLLEIYKQL